MDGALTVGPSRPDRAAGVDHQSRVENAEEVGRLGAVPVQLPVEAVLRRRRLVVGPLGSGEEEVLAEGGVLGRAPHLIQGLHAVFRGVGRVVEVLGCNSIDI